MQRNVYFLGELANQFGSKFQMKADTTADILSNIAVNREGFRQYLIDAIVADKGMQIKYEDKIMEDEADLLLTLKPGDVTFSLVPAGSGGDTVKNILVGAAIVIGVAMTGGAMLGAGAFSVFTGAGAFTAGLTAATGAGGLTGLALTIAKGVGMSMMYSGISELLTDDPSQDSESTNYLFNGGNTDARGVNIPICYGELRIPGKNINLTVSGKRQESELIYSTGQGDLDYYESR
jgi:predicted phage tail protein